VDLGVAYKEDTDRVCELIRGVGAEMQDDEKYGPSILEPVEILGVDNFADSAVVIKLRIKTLPIKQWEVGREFRRRIKYCFDREGIEIPFPHRSIYFGEASKPLVFQMENNGAQMAAAQRGPDAVST
jgi:small conductance mechanosensitive channel